MTLGGKRIGVAIPDTVLEEHDSIREKTAKLGQIARYCSIFGVDSIRIFNDPRGKGEGSFMKKVLEYLETPQYLRRRLFPLSEELRFAGLLPPLRIPSHKPKVPLASLRPGEYRDGVVLADGLTVDAGLDRPVTLKKKEAANKRVTLKITGASQSGVQGVRVDRKEVNEYWGYSVEVSNASSLLSDPSFPLRIATSKNGDPIQRVAMAVIADFSLATGVLMLFGSPSRGLFESIGKDLRSRVNYVVNLYPEQHVATVRSEEAILSALTLLGLIAGPGLIPFA